MTHRRVRNRAFMDGDHASESERPDLALFIPSYAGGGGERVALFLARTLAEAGLQVDLVVACARGELEDEPVPGVRKVDLRAVTEVLAAPAWVRYLRRVRPRCAMSMIHTANLSSGIGAYLVPEVPVIVNLRIALECDPSAQWWFRKRFGFAPERFLYRRASRVVGVSEGVAEEARVLLGIPPEKVSSIPNPRQSRRAASPIAEEHAWIFEDEVILGVGRLAPQKDFASLLNAFARVAEKRNVRLVLLGKGPERAALVAQARELGCEDRVHLLGFVDDPQPYMKRARLFVLSSRNEGFPGALIEALEAGMAIVSTDCPFGPREALEGDPHSRLVEVGDPKALARAIEASLAEPDVGTEARRASRAERMARYEPAVITARYLELVGGVIREHEAIAQPLPGKNSL